MSGLCQPVKDGIEGAGPELVAEPPKLLDDLGAPGGLVGGAAEDAYSHESPEEVPQNVAGHDSGFRQ